MTAGEFRAAILERFAMTEESPEAVAGFHLLSAARVAKVLDVGKRTIERELEEGALATTWIRGTRRVSVVDLADYLAERRRVGRRLDDSETGLFPS